MKKAHPTDAGYDLESRVETVIRPGETRSIPTGVYGDVPPGTVGMVCSRSGLALKRSIAVLNAPGIVDSGYTGEVCVILHNFGGKPFTINPGDRIAQMVYLPLSAYVPGDESDRGDGGFGSTGS